MLLFWQVGQRMYRGEFEERFKAVLDEVLVAGVFDRVAEVGRVVQRRMERQGEGKEEGEEAAGHACSMWASMVTGQFNVLAM